MRRRPLRREDIPAEVPEVVKADAPPPPVPEDLPEDIRKMLEAAYT